MTHAKLLSESNSKNGNKGAVCHVLVQTERAQSVSCNHTSVLRWHCDRLQPVKPIRSALSLSEPGSLAPPGSRWSLSLALARPLARPLADGLSLSLSEDDRTCQASSSREAIKFTVI